MTTIEPYEPLPCPMAGCGQPLALEWVVGVALLGEDVADADNVPVPAEAAFGTWRVECLAGHRPLVPGPVGCNVGHAECVESCEGLDVDWSDELREFRRGDLGRLRRLVESAQQADGA